MGQMGGRSSAPAKNQQVISLPLESLGTVPEFWENSWDCPQTLPQGSLSMPTTVGLRESLRIKTSTFFLHCGCSRLEVWIRTIR